MTKQFFLGIAALLATLIATPVFAQSDVPEESAYALQNMFAVTRDKLWECNDKFWHRGEYERCIAMMRLITQVDPHDMDAYDNGAWLMQNQLRDEDAEAFLLDGLPGNSDTYDIYFALGYFYYIHERPDEAIDYLAIAVTLEPPMFAWHTLAHAYEYAGDVDSALSVWTLRAAVDPDNPVPHIQIDRIMSGEPPSDTPGMVSRAREERKARAGIQ
ncbi:MAG: hypothetical protein ABFD49_05195 [Armatimonadota bacterium]|nr:hypothetical protein [bacterium]